MKSGLNGGWPVRGSRIWTELLEKNDARSVEKCGKQVPKSLWEKENQRMAQLPARIGPVVYGYSINIG